MEESLVTFFEEYRTYAVLISIFLNIIIAILGLIPSFFLTAANLLFFGVWSGAIISFIGESVGAAIAFMLYRKGLKRFSWSLVEKYPSTKKLLWMQGREAFKLILSLRLLPFVPSGIVTLLSAMGKVSFPIFLIASTLGKLPALLIEVYSVYQVTTWTWVGKVILLLFGLYLIFIVFLKKTSRT